MIKLTYRPNRELGAWDLNFETGGYDLNSEGFLRSGGWLNATEIVLS